MTETFVRFSAEKLEQSTGRIEDCFGRLTDEQVWMRGSDAENAVGNLVLHLCGNVTQWIGSGVAGRPDQRIRDAEFAAHGTASTADLKQRLRTTMNDAVSVIRALTPEDLQRRTQVQKHDITVMEAIYHVVTHFSEHTGQILFATKLFTGQDLGAHTR